MLDREQLARAFETDDFDTVMAPVGTVVGNALEAADVLERLRGLARAAA